MVFCKKLIVGFLLFHCSSSQLTPIKTPTDFKGDIYDGVKNYINLNDNIRPFLPYSHCDVNIDSKSVECYWTKSGRHITLQRWLENVMKEDPTVFTHYFTFLMSNEDKIVVDGPNGIKK